MNAKSAGATPASSAAAPSAPPSGPTGAVNAAPAPATGWANAATVNTTITAISRASMPAAAQLAGAIRPTESAVTSSRNPKAISPVTPVDKDPAGVSAPTYVAAATRIDAVDTSPSSMNSTAVTPPATGPSAPRTSAYTPPADGKTEPTSA